MRRRDDETPHEFALRREAALGRDFIHSRRTFADAIEKLPNWRRSQAWEYVHLLESKVIALMDTTNEPDVTPLKDALERGCGDMELGAIVRQTLGDPLTGELS